MQYRNGDSVTAQGKVVGTIYDDTGKLHYQIAFDGCTVAVPIPAKYVKRNENIALNAKEYKPGRYK